MASPYGPKQSLSLKLQQKLSPQQIQLMKLLQIPTATLEQRIQEELEINPALEEGDETADLSEGMSEMDLSDAELNYYEREKIAESGNSDADITGSDTSTEGGVLDDVEHETRDDYSDEDDNLSSHEDDGPDLDDYLMDFIEDDPSTYKTRDEGRGGDEEEKSMPLAFENTFHEYLEQQLGMLDLEDEREHAIALQIIGSIDDDGYMRREPAAMVDDLLFSQNISAYPEANSAV
jgi:RNA polymerase sigma-54 factor